MSPWREHCTISLYVRHISLWRLAHGQCFGSKCDVMQRDDVSVNGGIVALSTTDTPCLSPLLCPFRVSPAVLGLSRCFALSFLSFERDHHVLAEAAFPFIVVDDGQGCHAFPNRAIW